MIFITDNFILKPDNALSVKIGSVFSAYGNKYDFCKLYSHRDEKGNSCNILKFGSAFTVDADYYSSEITEFITFSGYSEVQSSYKLLSEYDSKIVLKTENKNIKDVMTSSVDYFGAYNILSQDLPLPEFDEWYVDISHRVRHSSAILFCDSNSCAVVLKYKDFYYINGFAVTRENRGNGCGKKFLTEIISSLNGIVYVAADVGVDKFYVSCGFGQICQLYYSEGENVHTV